MSALLDKYSGFVVDSHITEEDDSFLSKLTPEAFVSMMKKTGADSVMAYAACHNGNCYYPSRVGHMHKGLKGRDHFGQTISLLRKEGIIPRAYCSIVYQRRIARENPHFRVHQIDGTQSYRRSWHCCPNSMPYRAYAKEHVREICAYDIDGIFIDMTFWPGVCFCPSCRTRFLKEHGREIPQTVDWNDPDWVAFQRAREGWLSEFAHELTDAVKSVNPRIAVAHQFSPVILGWMYGQTHALATASDIPSGDFYGGKHQHRFGAKVLAAFEKHLPFEFMTSRCVTLYDHTSTKSDEEMLRSCATTLANGGTYLLIDAINPDGSLEPKFYDRMRSIADALQPFRRKLAELRPKLVADTGLYFSMASYVRRDHNGSSLRAIMNPANNMLAATDLRPLQEALGTSIILNRAKHPYRVVTDHTADFAGLRTIIINDGSFLSQDEVVRLREFVRGGGTLIATGFTSYYDLDGKTTGDFALKDVFGVSYAGRFSKMWNYVAPDDGGVLVSNDVPCPLVHATTAQRLASLVEPMFDHDDLDHFASYHSNPPGKPGAFSAMTINPYGRGTCVYLASSVFARQHHAQQTFGKQLLARHAPSSIVHACDAPGVVEMTLLRGTCKGSYLLCFVNYQDESPSIPVHGISVTLSLPCGGRPRACRCVRTGQDTPYEREADRLTFRVPILDAIEMIELEMEQAPWLASP
jgi:hypothetical protein